MLALQKPSPGPFQIIILLYVILPLLFSSFIAHIYIPEQYGLVLPVFELHIKSYTICVFFHVCLWLSIVSVFIYMVCSYSSLLLLYLFHCTIHTYPSDFTDFWFDSSVLSGTVLPWSFLSIVHGTPVQVCLWACI